MPKLNYIYALMLSIIACSAQAADAADTFSPATVGGFPSALSKGQKEPENVKTVDGIPVVEDDTKQKLMSVKDLFKASKKRSDEALGASPAPEPEVNLDTETTDSDVQFGLNEIKDLNELDEEIGSDDKTQQDSIGMLESSLMDAQKTSSNLENVEGRSIMFDQANIYRVMRVLAAYIESNSNKADDVDKEQSKKSLEELQQELLAKLKPEEFIKGKKDIITIRLPAYVKLDSIIYRSADNKKAWVNQKKFIEGEDNGELSAVSIQKNYAYINLSIKDTNIDPVELQSKLEKSKSASKIRIDLDKQVISFRLAVNQYIDLTKLVIYEGNFNLSSVDVTNKASHYYDPMKPSERFVPLEEAEKAAEAIANNPNAAIKPSEKTSDPELQAIDAIEVIDESALPDTIPVKP